MPRINPDKEKSRMNRYTHLENAKKLGSKTKKRLSDKSDHDKRLLNDYLKDK
jgi:hypothetical protein